MTSMSLHHGVCKCDRLVSIDSMPSRFVTVEAFVQRGNGAKKRDQTRYW